MKAKLTQLVVDASVIAKWFFPIEDENGVALRIRDDLLNHNLSLVEPELIYYEISNLLKSATKTLRITSDQAKSSYQGFLDLELTVYSSKEMLEEALELAIKYDISSYDAIYLALSNHLNVPFITADRKLLDKVPSDLILDITRYR